MIKNYIYVYFVIEKVNYSVNKTVTVHNLQFNLLMSSRHLVPDSEYSQMLIVSTGVSGALSSVVVHLSGSALLFPNKKGFVKQYCNSNASIVTELKL